jgi:predicted transposase/invertase (TIGR01784 family)
MFDNISKFLVLETITDNRVRGNLMTAASVFGGLVLKPELIKTILRSEIMKESAVYQEILQEGEQRGLLKGEQIGLLKGKLETIPLLTKLGLTIAEIAEELDIDIALVDQFVANQNH